MASLPSDVKPSFKRTAAAADNTNPFNRAVKRRASKACQCCRARKVRCNVIENGTPCTNCRLDEVQCIVTESKRRNSASRKFWAAQNDGKESTLRTPRQSNRPPAARNSQDVPLAMAPPSISQNNHSSDSTSRTPVEPVVDRPTVPHVPHLIYQRQGCQLSLQERRRRLSLKSTWPQRAPLSIRHLPAEAQCHSVCGHAPETEGPGAVLPEYISPMPAHIMLEDAIYLTQKGAMTIPPKPLRDDLLRAYSDHVHPVLPFIELSEFLRIVRLGDPSSGSISLLLFQAVMFAATGSVDIDSLREAGFTTRKAARKFFYRRVKLLYDFDYEVNRLTIVKALLLMTLWDQSPDDHKGSWYWMGIAASLAFSIGLPREQECAPSFQNDKRCRKRLWWSLVVRDRLIALEMRRRPHIGAEVSETPMISIDDFTIASLQEVIPGGPSQSSLARDVEMQHQAAITFIATAELSSCIAWMLSSYRSTLGYSHAAMREQDQKPKSKQSRPKAESFEPCEEHPDDFGLANWLEKLPFQARHHTPTQGEYRDSQIPIIIQRAVLRMLFNSSLIHLHDPEAVFSASCSWSDSRQTVKHHVLPGPAIQAASEITSIAQDLRGLGLINILPSTGASALLSAANTHLLNLKFSVGDHQRASLREFARCMQILIQLRETYASVETAVHLLEDTIRKEEIDVNQDTTRDAHHLMTRGHPASDMLFKSGRRLLDQPQIPTFTEHHPRMSSSDRLPSDTTPPSSQPSDGQNPEVKTLHSCRTLITPPSSDSDSRSQSVNTAADSTSHNQDRLTLTTPLELDSESPSSFGSLVDLEVEGEIEPLFPLISADMGRTMDAGDAKGADDGLLVAMEWMREMDHEEGVGSAVMVGGVGY